MVVLAVVDPYKFQVLVNGRFELGRHPVRMEIDRFQQRFDLVGVTVALFERYGIAGDSGPVEVVCESFLVVGQLVETWRVHPKDHDFQAVLAQPFELADTLFLILVGG